MKKTTIRMALTPAEVEASLQLIESLPEGSTINRTFSSCLEQLYRAFLTTATRAKDIPWLTEADASKALINRKEKSGLNVDAIPMEELNLVEDKAKELVQEDRMNKIKANLLAANTPPEVGTNVEYPIGGIKDAKE